MSNKIEAVTNAIVTIRTDAKATIKAVSASLESAGVDLTTVSTKTKALFAENLRSLLDTFVDEEKALAEANALTELESIKVDIESTIQRAGSSSFELGSLLLKAREACENQQEFIDWVDSNFGIRRLGPSGL